MKKILTKYVLTKYGALALAVALMMPLAQAQPTKNPGGLRRRCRNALQEIHRPRAA